ncbi:MAG TPA: disulfide bond formation protein B [Acetobacteraceae bacterium]|jgi:disulfide bond formation protein DsbB
MMIPRLRVVLALSALAAAAAFLVAYASEIYGGLVPCALCLIERWPYRIAVALGVVGLVLPRSLARLALALLSLTMLVGAGIAATHVGVERGWWPDPLPQCAAPHFSGGSIAERLASMPATPSKSCEDPTYLIPSIPISMATMDLIFALALAALTAIFLWRSRRSPA